MGFTSIDDMVAKLSSGQNLRRDAVKTTSVAHTAGGWHLLAGLAGNPPASTFPGTDLVWRNCDENVGDGTTNFSTLIGGPVLPATRHVVTAGASAVAGAGAPWQLKLVDLQGYYRLSAANVTGTGSRVLINNNTFTASQSGSDVLLTYTNDFNSGTKIRVANSGGALPGNLLANTDYWMTRISATTCKLSTSYADYVAGVFVAWSDAGSGTQTMTIRMPRYENGVGCQAFFVVQTQPSTGGPNLSASAYTNSDGVGSHAFQGSPTFGATADAYATRIPHSGLAAGRYGAFLPMQGGDSGVARVDSFTLSGGTAYTGSGVLALCIARPILDIPIPVSGMYTERDLVNQLPSLPRVYDGACLQWLMFSTGATTANTPITSAFDFAWGG